MNADAAAAEPTAKNAAEPAVAGSRRTRVGVVVAVVLVVVLLALLAISGKLWLDHRRTDRSAAAETAGRTAATVFFTLDPEHLTQQSERMLALSTGAFRSDYRKQQASLREQVTRNQVSVKASVPDNGTALEYLDDDRAQVLVAIDTTTSLPKGKTQSDTYRIRVELSRSGDRWLVSGLEQVG